MRQSLTAVLVQLCVASNIPVGVTTNTSTYIQIGQMRYHILIYDTCSILPLWLHMTLVHTEEQKNTISEWMEKKKAF